MADYRAIARRYPAVREYIRLRKWVHRGDTVAYGPNLQGEHLSTDEFGFRHSVFNGRTFSVSDCLRQRRYGLVLGSSNVYGFGLSSNAATFPSVLAEMFGFPFANVSFPEGQTRTLCGVLTNIMTRMRNKPSAVLLLTGGDFTSFCYTGIADPVFGSPNLYQTGRAIEERAGRVDLEAGMRSLLSYTALWVGAIVNLCKNGRAPVALGEDVTFFEKAEPTANELGARLGVGMDPKQEQLFKIHRACVKIYGDRRCALAEKRRVPIGGPGHGNAITYIDEFHYDDAGTRALAEYFAEALRRAGTEQL